MSTRPPTGTRSKPELSCTEDADVLRAVASGDDVATTRLYDRFSPFVFSICLRMLHDRALAEDLAEDVFVEIWRRAAQYDSTRASVATWIATITRSRGIDRLRTNRRQGFHRTGSAAVEAIADDDPTRDVLSTDERQRVTEALRVLSPDQRAAIELAYFEDISHSEVATRLARPLGTIKTHIRQGLIRLREALRTPGEDPA